MVGIAAITAALIILLSAFNGIERMIEDLYSEYDTDITIRAAETKTFNDQRIDFKKLKAISGVKAYSRAVEEVVILKHEKKWVNTKLVGVEDEFLTMTNMKKHMVERGRSVLHEDTTDYQKVWCKKTIIHPPFLIPISTIRCKRLMPHLSDRALLESPLAFQEFNVTSYSETPAASDTAFVN